VRIKETRPAGDLELRVEQKIAVDNHTVAFGQAFEHREVVAGTRPELGLGQLIAARFPLDIYQLPAARREHGLGRHRQHALLGGLGFRCTGHSLQRHVADVAVTRLIAHYVGMHRADVFSLQPCRGWPAVGQDRRAEQGLGVHAGLEPAFRVLHDDSNSYGSRRVVEHWLDEPHHTRQRPMRFAFDRHLHRLARFDPGEFRFVDLGHQPYMAQVGDRVERFSLLDVLPVADVLLDHRPADRRVDGHVGLRSAGPQQFIDLGVGNAPQLQPAAGAGCQRCAQAAASRLQRFFAAIGREELLLGADQFRAVDLDEMLAHANRRARKVGENPVDTPVDPSGDLGHTGLIQLHSADGSQLFVERLSREFGRDHTGHRARVLAERQFCRRTAIAAFHDGGQIHAAERADIGMIHADLRVHGTCVPGSFRAGFRSQGRRGIAIRVPAVEPGPGRDGADRQAGKKEYQRTSHGDLTSTECCIGGLSPRVSAAFREVQDRVRSASGAEAAEDHRAFGVKKP